MKTIIIPIIYVLMTLSAVSVSAEGSSVRNLVISDFAYYYQGARSENLEAFRDAMERDINATFVVSICKCANSDFAFEALELLKGLGAKNIALKAADDSVTYCVECDV